MNPKVYYLSLGSNLKNREKSLEKALRKIQEFKVHVRRISSIYETEPVGFLDQPYFLNSTAKVETRLCPFELLALVKKIEFGLGRGQEIPNGPRIIDIDILLSGNRIIDAENLIIPHPRLHLRNFVLYPLAEIAPRVRHPVLKMSVLRLLQQCSDGSKIKKWKSK